MTTPKLQELFELAADKPFPTTLDSIHPNELERFAESIVKECMRISSESGSSTMIADRIAEHFGVPYGLR